MARRGERYADVGHLRRSRRLPIRGVSVAARGAVVGGAVARRPTFDWAIFQASPDGLPDIDIHSR